MVAVAGDVMVHLKQAGVPPEREGRRGTGMAQTRHELGGTEVAPLVARNVDAEVIDGAEGRISG